MTRREMHKIIEKCNKVKKGYCCHYSAPERNRLIKLGSNSGIYGWNWDLFIDPQTNTAYIDGYRNF